LLCEYSPRKLGVESVASVATAVVALTLTSQRRPRPSSTVRRDDDVMLAAKDDAISGVMHRRRWRRRRRYRRVGGGDGGGGGSDGDERRGFSDGRTFLLHVASVSLLSSSPAFARGFRVSGILLTIHGTGTCSRSIAAREMLRSTVARWMRRRRVPTTTRTCLKRLLPVRKLRYVVCGLILLTPKRNLLFSTRFSFFTRKRKTLLEGSWAFYIIVGLLQYYGFITFITTNRKVIITQAVVVNINNPQLIN